MKVFLSHASQDSCIGEEVSLALKGLGFEVFFDKNDLPAGGDYHSQIRNAIDLSGYFVFLISPESVTAGRYTPLNSIAQKLNGRIPEAGFFR